MTAEPAACSAGGFRLVCEREIHAGPVFRLVEGEYETPDGLRIRRQVVRHPGAVAVVPIDGAEAVLVRQFRAALQTEVLEIPAGVRDVPGEPRESTARRELAEEVGLAASEMQPLGGFATAVGFCDEIIWLFLATGLQPVASAPDGAEEAHMTVERLPLAEVPAAIDDGRILDAKTVIGLQIALRRLGA